ncbi:MAG: hypothetical protein GX180_09815 [Enterococcus sp.]|nr:hypothetical protein [Enterococcus sp.]
MKRIPKTISMPEDVFKWYDDNSRKIGMNATAYINFALKTFIDQQKALVSMEKVLLKLDELQKNLADEFLKENEDI